MATKKDLLEQQAKLKMEIEKFKTKIDKIQTKVEKLEEKIQETEENKTRWRAKRGKNYYTLSEFGNAKVFQDWEDKVDKFAYESGQYFKTKEEAEKYKEKLIICQKLKDLAMEMNQEEPLDWHDQAQQKWYIYYDYINDKLGLTAQFYYYCPTQIYCTNNNFLEKAIEKIGEEDMLKFFTIEQ